jgi:FkbM family methyltransferase
MTVASAGVDEGLVFDVGLYDGVDTAYYLRRGYRVVAVDADPEAVAAAEVAFRETVRSGRLTLVHGAISSGDAESVTLYVSDHRDWSSLSPGIAGRSGVAFRELVVPTTSIGDLLERFGTPAYLKIDIEGMDEVALGELGGSTARPPYVSVEAECADDSRQGDEEALQKLDLLLGLGYARFKLVDQSSLRVLSLDDLELGRRASLGERVRRKLRRHGGEPLNTLAVAGQRTEFPVGATGPFGEDLAGDWLDEADARSLLVAARAAYFGREDVPAYGFWCDWHAAR